MEIAVVNPQTVLQMYHCKEYPWHQIVSPVADKEMIIANADFTTTSAIARRRLSSKKRKKPGSCQEGGLSDSSSTSPLYSPPRNSSPAVSSTTQTPPPAQESESGLQPLTCEVPERRYTHTTTTIHTTHTSPPRPQVTAATGTSVPLPAVVGATMSGSLVPLAPAPYHLSPVRSPATEHDLQQQLANPMPTQLQQELNYRYLQGQGAMHHGTGGSAAFSVPHSQPEMPLTQPSTQAVMETSPESSGWPHKVKWCCAHVTIAKQIQAHRLQTKMRPEMVSAHPENFATLGAKPATGVPVPAVFDTTQRMALMQMYGIPPATTLAGYMAMPNVPYSVQDLQMHMQPFVQPAPASFVNTTNIISVKPNSSMAAQTAEGMGFPMVNNVQLVPYPVATVLPAGMNSLVQGSYVGPVPVIGNCVINPCPPGIMASPWVR